MRAFDGIEGPASIRLDKVPPCMCVRWDGGGWRGRGIEAIGSLGILDWEGVVRTRPVAEGS